MFTVWCRKAVDLPWRRLVRGWSESDAIMLTRMYARKGYLTRATVELALV